MKPSPAEFLERHPEITRLLKEIPKEGLAAIVLFGSEARGTARPFSDIDLCIIPATTLTGSYKETLLSYSSRKIQISFLPDLPPAVQYRVFRDGMCLWVGDELALHRSRMAALRAYRSVRRLIDRHTDRILG